MKPIVGNFIKPTAEQIALSVERLTCLPMFPSEMGARQEIMRTIYRMVNCMEELNWLVTTMVDRADQWRGPVELRGVFCTKFTPADGVEATCKFTPGYTAEECEVDPYEAEERKALAAPADPFHGVFSHQRQERTREMRDFVALLEDRIRTAPRRLGADAPRAIKQLEKMANLARNEVAQLEAG